MLTSLLFDFSVAQGQLTLKSVVEFRRNSNSSKFFICRNEKDPIKNKGSRVLTRFSPLKVYGSFSKRSRAANSLVCGRILPNFKLVREIMVVLHTRKNEEDPIKNEDAKVLTCLLFDFSDAQGQLTLKSAVEFLRNSNSSKL